MSRMRGLHHIVGMGFPRVSGDEPKIPPRVVMRATFSPRERG